MMSFLRHVAVLLTIVLATPARAGDDSAKVDAAAARACDIATRLQEALDPDQKGRVTMAAGVLDDGHVIVATSEDRNIIRSPVDEIKRAEGYELATFLRGGHAEAKIIAHVQGSLFYFKSRKILAIAAGISICEKCEKVIRAAGIRPASRCRSERKK